MGLIGNVEVGGRWYGPAYGSTEWGVDEAIPPEVAAQIGEHCWAPGTAPHPVKPEVVEETPAAKPEALAEPVAEPEPDSGRRGRGRSKG